MVDTKLLVLLASWFGTLLLHCIACLNATYQELSKIRNYYFNKTCI
jgi:hypothetical protein